MSASFYVFHKASLVASIQVHANVQPLKASSGILVMFSIHSFVVICNILYTIFQLLPDLSKCQQAFATSLEKFRFSYIGGAQTDDEIVISGSLKEFGKLIHQIEEERQRVVSVLSVPLFCL